MSLRELTNEPVFGSASVWRLAFLCTRGVSPVVRDLELGEGGVEADLSREQLQVVVRQLQVLQLDEQGSGCRVQGAGCRVQGCTPAAGPAESERTPCLVLSVGCRVFGVEC